jgi:hypothetical protein
MRSPWKIIAGLVSRGASEAPEESVEASAKIPQQIDDVSYPENAGKLPDQAGAMQPAPLRSQTEPSTAVVQLPERNVTPSDAKFIAPSGVVQVTRGIAHEKPGSVSSQAHVAKPNRTAVKKPKDPAKPSLVPATSSTSLPETDVPLSTMALDNEISQLRELLSQKLRLQNDELKRLLLRYDQR